MPIHATRRARDWSNFEVGDRMVDDFKVGLEVGVCDLLEEDSEFVFDFLGFMEEVELILVLLG